MKDNRFPIDYKRRATKAVQFRAALWRWVRVCPTGNSKHRTFKVSRSQSWPLGPPGRYLETVQDLEPYFLKCSIITWLELEEWYYTLLYVVRWQSSSLSSSFSHSCSPVADFPSLFSKTVHHNGSQCATTFSYIPGFFTTTFLPFFSLKQSNLANAD